MKRGRSGHAAEAAAPGAATPGEGETSPTACYAAGSFPVCPAACLTGWSSRTASSTPALQPPSWEPGERGEQDAVDASSRDLQKQANVAICVGCGNLSGLRWAGWR